MRTIAKGCKSFGNGEAWISWWLFPRMNEVQTRDMMYDRLDLHGYYGGPGMGFADKPVARHSKSYTLIYQRGGLDV